MKVSKPKENQLLFEDDSFKHFDLEVKSKTGLNESSLNDIYESFILFYRFKGMDASKQMFMGNQVSIVTALTSIINRLLATGIMSKDILEDVVKLATTDMEK